MATLANLRCETTFSSLLQVAAAHGGELERKAWLKHDELTLRGLRPPPPTDLDL